MLGSLFSCPFLGSALGWQAQPAPGTSQTAPLRASSPGVQQRQAGHSLTGQLVQCLGKTAAKPTRTAPSPEVAASLTE